MDNQIVPVENKALTPSTWGMIEAIVATTTVSNSEKAQVARKLLFCYENQLPLSLALNGGLNMISNRLVMEGIVIRGKINQHPDYAYKIIKADEDGATMEFYRHDELLGEVSFTKDDAARADLSGKENYKKYPAEMYLNRATSKGYKMFCPEIFMSPVYVRGEIQGDDYVIEGEIVRQTTMDDLIAEYGHDAILEAMNNGAQSPIDIVKYFESKGENENE